MRGWAGLVVLGLGCVRGPERAEAPRSEVSADAELAAELAQRVRVATWQGGLIYWRIRGPAGPICEPWRFVAQTGEGARGLLVRARGEGEEGPELRLRYHLTEEHLALSAPELERPAAEAPGETRVTGRSLPCVYSGRTLVARDGDAKRIVLDARERFFLARESCERAGEAAAADEVRPLGCASALADLATRARLADAPAGGEAAGWLRGRRFFYLLRRGARGPACEAWAVEPDPESPRHGRLVLRGRDAAGPFVRTFGYEAEPGLLTLQGPTERRGVARGAELVRAEGCLVTRAVEGLSAEQVRIGQEPWYLSELACEAARRRGAPAGVEPSCRPP